MSVITFIASGTRGDVQPAVAVGKALRQHGHTVRVLAGANFADWIQQHGLIPLPTQIDMQAMMASEGGRDWVEKGHNPVLQLRIMGRLLAKHGMQIASDAWDACQGSDLIVSSFTSDVYAVGMAQKLGVPHVSAPLQPTLFTTRDGRTLLNAPLPNRSSWINYWFGKFFIETAAWSLYRDIANRVRKEMLGMPAQTRAENREDRRKMTIIHGYSPSVVPHPADWPDNFHTAGYWLLDENEQWQPPGELLDFLAAGLRAGVPSILVPHFADQPFWGQRVAALGVGSKAIMRHKLTAHKLAAAIDAGVSNQTMRQKATQLGQKIRAEDGIARAVTLIEEEL
ncbi:glycosyltransferase [Candidatus Leptofilum sp.]|uniref:glycosyltransferase n=1 Tax=Candidatus Leptofilum sp. TaxID=3241576 RepID=UPI003B5AF4AC